MRELREFTAGKMNKGADERIVPQSQYIDAMNVRINSSGDSGEIGAVQNVEGSRRLTALEFAGVRLSFDTVCLGVFADDANETIYWFVHDPGGTNADSQTTDEVDMIVSYNMNTEQLLYHAISVDVLNFNPTYLINGINKIGDLLFFTDDYNPPRRINVTRNYPFPTGSPYSDNITEDDFSVIQKPPVNPPSINLIDTGSDENFMEDKFISFAYRYRYKDGEYSALSQFSEVAFEGKNFNFDRGSYDNEGMTNKFNAVEVTFNTGSDNVTDVQLCYKLSDSNIINVIQNYDKIEFGLPHNINHMIVFDNSKIYTSLPSSELLRLFDNVPRFAKSQTIIGGRLVYGNYVDGFNMVDSDGAKVKMTYTAERRVLDVFESDATTTLHNVTYDISGSSVVVDDAEARVDLSNQSLEEGETFSLVFNFSREASSTYVRTADEIDEFSFEMEFTLPKTYSSIYDLFNSGDFIRALGFDVSSQGYTNILPINTTNNVGDNEFCDSTSNFTEQYMCAYESIRSRTSMSIVGNGIDAVGTSIGSLVETRQIEVTPSTGSSIVSFKFPAFKINHAGADFYEYFSITSVDYLSSIAPSGVKSLHSNRDYDVGVVYMDEYNRSSTVHVSQNNTVYMPPSGSDERNTVRVRIPTSQKPPIWATKYKFFMKSSNGDHETIYSDIVYINNTDGTVYFKLEGDNQNKMKTGDRLIVKSDSSGVLNTLVECTVLEVESFAEDDVPGQSTSLDGLYMSIKPDGDFDVSGSAATIKTINPDAVKTKKNKQPILKFQLWEGSPTADIPISTGDVISMKITHHREGSNDDCRGFYDEYVIDDYVSQSDYANFKEFFDGHLGGINIDDAKIASGSISLASNYDSSTGSTSSNIFEDVPNGEHNFQFVNTSSGIEFWTQAGRRGCRGMNKFKAKSKGTIKITSSEGTFIFETKPIDLTDEIYYEGSQVFEIGTDSSSNRIHKGNTQDQNTATNADAICDLNFFNCIMFSNGAESMKASDRQVAHKIVLGQRSSAVSETEYKEEDRGSSLTYSGVFVEETNLNRLNEFNLGLVNFQDLDRALGEVMVLSDVGKDLLVLQEDRISHLLINNSLITTSSGNVALTAESDAFFSTQTARSEEYGISKNPESFVRHGYDYFFTDAKRGAVIRLTGNNVQSLQMSIISDVGLRSYFRDNLKANMDKQHIGGFDEHADEFVLASTDVSLPEQSVIEPCDIIMQREIRTIRLTDEAISTEIDLGDTIGDVAVEVNISDIAQFISEGSQTSNPSQKTSGTTTSSATNKLIDINARFGETVLVNDQVRMTDDTGIATISSIDSDTQLTLSSDIATSGQRYEVYAFAEGRKLIDSNATFVSDGVAINDIIFNKTTGVSGSVKSVSSETELIQNGSGVVKLGDEYLIKRGSAGSITPTITWDGSTQGGSGVPKSGNSTFTFNKSKAKPSTMSVEILYPQTVLGEFVVKAPCPDAEQLNVTHIVLSSNESEDKTVGYAQSRIESGGYSDLEGGQYVLGSGSNATVVSQFVQKAGLPGNGVIPASGDTIRLGAFNTGSFVLDDMTAAQPVHRFRLLSSSTQYTASDIQTILAHVDLESPSSVSADSAGTGYFGDFTYSPSAGENYLYLIWDLRNVRRPNDFKTVSPISSFTDNLYTACCDVGTDQYYVDADDPLKVRGVFSDRDLSTMVSDGLYSRGTGIAYYIDSGGLSEIIACPQCATPCASFGTRVPASVMSNQEEYRFTTDLTSATGAVVIRLKSNITLAGALYNADHAGMLLATLGSNTYNSYTSSLDGFVEKFWSYNGVVSPLPSSGSATIPFSTLEYNGTGYDSVGNQNVFVDSSEVTQATGAAEYVMVVPKTTATPIRMTINLFSVKSQLFELTVSCPAALPSFTGFYDASSSVTACAGTPATTYYHSTFSTGSGGTPVVNDIIFTNSNGSTRAAAGFYKVGTDVLTVDSNGVVTNKTGC
tara:strand:+ start:256 stop:6108 length:5853 start_codon:yes stop_codon:yes gene_type:complete